MTMDNQDNQESLVQKVKEIQSFSCLERFDRRDEPWKGQKGLYSKRWKRFLAKNKKLQDLKLQDFK